MWGSYVAGSGKLFGRFLGLWTSIACRRACSVLSRAALSPRPISCRVTVAKTLQGELCGEAEGRWWQQQAVSARRKNCEAKWPRVTLCEVVWTLRKMAGAVPMILPPAAWEQRAATLGEPSSFFFTTQSWLPANPMTHSPSSASATVSSKVNSGLWVWLSVSPP